MPHNATVTASNRFGNLLQPPVQPLLGSLSFQRIPAPGDHRPCAQSLAPAQSLTVCLKLSAAELGPQRIAALLELSVSVPSGGALRLHSATVTVYVLPEPIIASGGTRLGDFQNCLLAHNSHRTFQGTLQVRWWALKGDAEGRRTGEGGQRRRMPRLSSPIPRPSTSPQAHAFFTANAATPVRCWNTIY